MTEQAVAHQFADAEQQRSAATFGMWLFLCTEVLLFGALFLAYAICRIASPEAFEEAAQHTLLIAGTVNTAVLLVSSFCVAVAVHFAEAGRRLRTTFMLWIGTMLGICFLGIKAYEYYHEIQEGFFPGPLFHFPGEHAQAAEMYFVLYFTMTGLHAVHVAIGVLLLAGYGGMVLFSQKPIYLATSIDLAGLYWHFVDLVWVFLFPLFYSLGRT